MEIAKQNDIKKRKPKSTKNLRKLSKKSSPNLTPRNN